MFESWLIGWGAAVGLKAFCAVFLGGLVRGYAGFGFALVSAPLMAFFLPPATLVPIMVVLSMFGGLQMVKKALPDTDWHSLKILFLSSLLGMPLGAYALIKMPEDYIRLIIGISVFLAAIGLLCRWRFNKMPSKKLVIGTGFLSGVLNTSTSLDGPPIIIYFLAMPDEESVGRSSLIVFFLMNAVCTLLLFAGMGVFNMEVIKISLFTIPALLLGNFIGDKIFDKTKGKAYRFIAIALLLVIAVLAIANAICRLKT